jgi:hypothetical protein
MWEEVMIIPDRMRVPMEEITGGRVMKIPNLLKHLIIQRCKNNLDSYNLTFPFIAEEDLAENLNSNQPFFIHIPDLP